MDGTLLSEKMTISAENRKWIRAASQAGITVVVATGRGVQNAWPALAELQWRSPIVTVNGSEVWTEPGSLLKRHTMEPGWIRRMHRMAVEFGVAYRGYAVEDIYDNERWADDIEGQTWLKFSYYSSEPEKLTAIRALLEEWGAFAITSSFPYNIELNPAGIDKASGIREVCRMLGIDMSDVMAIGDSINDIAMIRQAGFGVAMGNAHDEVKLAADAITATNDEDGVALAIRKYVLKGD